METNPYGSFASPKENVYAKWYVDGKDYFYAVSETLMAARDEIFIEDWWLSPELYLRRPLAHNENYRLDELLIKKASEGVKIYVVWYDENPIILYLNSKHAESALMKHPNIIVLRHAERGFWTDVEWGFHWLWNRVFPRNIKINHPETDPDSFWTHHEKIVVIDRHTAFIGGLDLCFGRYDTHAHSLADFPTIANFSEVWPGQDYNNVRIKDFEEVQKWKIVWICKEISARLPWHDISIGFIGDPAVDVANHFIQRWNFMKSRKAREYSKYPFLKESVTSENRGIRTYKYFNETAKVDPLKGTCSVQILRSACKWSLGIELEKSIHHAYVHTIVNANHFIYIENQFFNTATHNGAIFYNKIGKALVRRIIKAHRLKEKFRVIVMIPLIPGYEGQFDEGSVSSAILRLTMDLQYRTICRGDDKFDDSIWGQLKKADINPEDYISFYGLRTYAKIDSEAIKKAKSKTNIISETCQKFFKKLYPKGANYDKNPIVTEQIYIHSKLMIVDDQIVICGSANLNDRSLLGRHDSEIAAIIKDTDEVDSKLAGKSFKASKFAVSLRRHLFKEYLGLLQDSDDDFSKVTRYCYPPPLHIESESCLLKTDDEKKLEDPVSDEFFKLWRSTAEENTKIYNEVFHCLPSDDVKTQSDYENFAPKSSKVPLGHVYDESKIQKLEDIKGYLVLFPYDFLKEAETITFNKIKTLKDLKDDFDKTKLSAEDELIEDLTKSSLSSAFK
ncbi:phospholipase D/nuclease [Gigaspora margarita]|uniref:phospholipase D n=2 Tax=Gigaspora margarita TaxID=4874 RepID=A0A8H4B084_GIGMA|nr:phospholipase D/nuclease [Gigaspora margarita]